MRRNGTIAMEKSRNSEDLNALKSTTQMCLGWEPALSKANKRKSP